MTWADILAEIKRALKEPTSNGSWTDEELLRRANIAQSKIVRYTHCLKDTDVSLTSVSGTATYTKPTKTLKILRVAYGNDRLYGISVDDLDINGSLGNISSPWNAESDTPKNYYETPTSITLYPNPSDTGTVISIYRVIRPTDMTTTSSIPFDSADYLYDFHELITEYVLWKCKLEDKDETYAEHKGEFLKGVEELRKELKTNPDELVTFGLIRTRQTNKINPLPLW